MAFLIPENLPTRNDLPETVQQVAGYFRDLLPAEVTVWLEEQDGEHPALLVLDPGAGLLLIDCPLRTRIGLRKGKGLLGFIRKAPEFESTLQAITDRSERFQALLQAEPRLRRKLPTAATVALPMLSRGQFQRLAAGVDPFRYVLSDDFNKEGLRAVLVRILNPSHVVRRISEPEECLTRARIRPEIVISLPQPMDTREHLLFRPPEVRSEDVVRVLDREQERLAFHMRGGYRVIRGVAGSGKTLVLVHRARHLARHHPRQRFLLACFNVPLSKALESQIGSLRNVDVRTVDSLAAKIAWLNPKTNDDWVRQREVASERAASNGRWQIYDGVFVDEAQDLDPPALDMLHAVLRKGRSDFVVALDGAQNVYRKRAKWNPEGMTARGRTTFLRICYRNTREIADFAWRFLQQTGLGELTDDKLDDPTLIVPPEATSRSGVPPVVLQCSSADGEADEIVRQVQRMRDAGTDWGQIAVLYGTRNPFVDAVKHRLQGRVIPHVWVSENSMSKKEVMAVGDQVRLATFQGLKGLEFSRVLMCGVNHVHDHGGDDDTTRRKVAYVAMTRAMDELVITISGRGPIGQAIASAVE